VAESPTRRGQFRKYPNSNELEVFLPHNVYPFGVIGLSSGSLVCLASGGLSGRVGNTLEGITRIMYDFFGCEDAMVLDEGYDTFQVINPHSSEGHYKYTNEEILEAILRFTAEMLERELAESKPHHSLTMEDWPLNRDIVRNVREDSSKLDPTGKNPSDILIVRPHRSQMRSVIIFGVEKRSKIGDTEKGTAADE
jgi:hypothetical protein